MAAGEPWNTEETNAKVWAKSLNRYHAADRTGNTGETGLMPRETWLLPYPSSGKRSKVSVGYRRRAHRMVKRHRNAQRRDGAYGLPPEHTSVRSLNAWPTMIDHRRIKSWMPFAPPSPTQEGKIHASSC